LDRSVRREFQGKAVKSPRYLIPIFIEGKRSEVREDFGPLIEGNKKV